MKEADDYSELKASASGMITGLNVKAGDKVTGESPLAEIQLESSGYQVSCSISKNDARKLQIGDEATIENIWGDDVSSKVKSIKADTSNPNRQSIVVFAVEGNVQVGENLEFAVGGKSAKYDTVVPNSAVKEDADGRFVYVVKVKATPLGNRYIATKAKVELLASDTANSAIQGELSEYDNVVTNSSRPLDNKQQVRLTDN